MPAARAARTCSRRSGTRSAATVPGGKSFMIARPNCIRHLLRHKLMLFICIYWRLHYREATALSRGSPRPAPEIPEGDRMRAAVLHRFGEPLTEADVELAEPASDEVLVRVTDSGICHSDRTVHLGTQDRPLPLILGHEASGVVERVGSQVSGLVPGDHVVGSASANCGRCPWCARGLPQHCADKGQARADGSARLSRHGDQVHAFVGL